MSGALPKTNFTAINFKSNQKTLLSETDSGKTFRRQIQGQRFSFTVSISTYDKIRICSNNGFYYEAKK